MNWFLLILFVQFAMSGESQEPPGLLEDTGQPGTTKTQELSETDNCQIMSYQEIMLKNKFDLKKKEEEVQVNFIYTRFIDLFSFLDRFLSEYSYIN